jgi:FkbM family methyltransferase
MNRTLNFVKKYARSLVNLIKKKNLKKKLLSVSALSSYKYQFTEKDVDLYLSEKYVRLSPCITKSTDNPELLTVRVHERSIFWPIWLADIDLPWLYHEIFDDYDYNPSSYNHPSLGYENRKWIIDAGAAEGYFSIFALEKSNAKLICIEPLQMMKLPLEKTLDSYSTGKCVKIISAALSDKVGWGEIQVDDNHICDSKLTSNASVLLSAQLDPSLQRVPVTTLDQLGIDQALGNDGLIKMDIEGYEMAALSGAINLMKNHKPALAIAVYHDLENAKKCAEIIKAANLDYKIEFRGFYGYFDPPRPYMVFAY